MTPIIKEILGLAVLILSALPQITSSRVLGIVPTEASKKARVRVSIYSSGVIFSSL